MQTINSFLPIFPGFYNTVFEPDTAAYIEEGKTYDDYNWDYSSYYTTVANKCCEAIEEWLAGNQPHQNGGFKAIIKIKYEFTYSPKEYNFRTDSINVEYSCSKTVIRKIKAYLYKHLSEFKAYLEANYRSSDGFISNHSYLAEDWLNDIEHIHKFGSILHFILSREINDPVIQLYYCCEDHMWISSWPIESDTE